MPGNQPSGGWFIAREIGSWPPEPIRQQAARLLGPAVRSSGGAAAFLRDSDPQAAWPLSDILHECCRCALVEESAGSPEAAIEKRQFLVHIDADLIRRIKILAIDRSVTASGRVQQAIIEFLSRGGQSQTGAVPRQYVLQPDGRADIEDIALSVSAAEADADAFFALNHATAGMRLLFETGLARLDGRSQQADFLLAQAMGGGKTHLTVSFALIAKSPRWL
jgi:hypothetical protein